MRGWYAYGEDLDNIETIAYPVSTDTALLVDLGHRAP